jgi:intracellular sulfur oxidation DsrE/DsrF family protein
MNDQLKANSRREFLGQMAASSAFGLTAFAAPFTSSAFGKALKPSAEAEAWMKKAKGKHRVVFDASEPHNGMPLIWSWVFYHTNNESGTADDEMTSMVVLRHNAIPFALEDKQWAKYKLGEVFKVNDSITGKPALRNPYFTPGEGDFPSPAIEGIKKQQERGAMYCVCNMALTVYSAIVAKGANLKHEEVLNDWKAGLLPNVQVVPSGVWAIGRAQENGFGYCYAGG